MATENRIIDLTNPDSVAAGSAWWEDMTSRGGEGMVVKPLDFVVRGRRGLLQPAVKVRGREYLRIIYGPEYTDHLDVLRAQARPEPQAVAGTARVRTGCGGAGTVRPARAAAPCA